MTFSGFQILEKQYPQMVVAPAEGFQVTCDTYTCALGASELWPFVQVAIQFNIDTYDGDKPAFAHQVNLGELVTQQGRFDTRDPWQVALLKHYAMGTHLYKQFQVFEHTFP